MKRRQFIQTTLQASSATLLINTIAPRLSTAVSSSSSRQRALLVGVNDYSFGNTKNVESLKGCLNDVAQLKNLLIYRYGFNPADIITLTEEQATREAILTNFEQHLLTAQPNDTVVFAFSGHGAILPDDYQKDETTTAFLPYDHTVQANGEVNYITGTTLFLLRSALKTDNVTVILDCCYAGGGTRGDSTGRSAPAPLNAHSPETERQYQAKLISQLKLDAIKLNQYRTTQQGTKGVLLAAASPGQKASDATFGANYNAGAFTKFLTQILWENPALPFDAVRQAVTEALIGFIGKNAQRPEFTYSPDRATQLKSRSAFVTSTPISSIPAQGTVLSVDPATREVTLWLGGVAPSSLDLEAGAEFRCFANQSNKKFNPIAKLSKTIAPNFTAIATILPDQTLPEPGSLLQHYYRPIPADLDLRVGLDPSLNATAEILQNRPHLQAIAQTSGERFNSVDINLSQMTAKYQQLLKTKIPIGSYGLFTSQLEIIPNSFGKLGETVEQAVDRLDSVFKVALVKKLFGSMVVTTEELAEAAGIKAEVRLKDHPKVIVALPNRSKTPARSGQKLELNLEIANRDLQTLAIVASSNGKTDVFPSINGIELVSADVGTNIEILILVSPKPLGAIASQISELLNLSPSPSNQANRSLISSQIDSVLGDLREGSGSRSSGLSPLVISLPIRVA
jgi:Caspase domain